MKKIILYCLVATVLLACNKEDDLIFDKPANERLDEVLANYQNLLTSAPNGWKMFTFPAEGGYTYILNFENDGSVTTLFDIVDATMVNPETTTYRLRALQAPSLVFDTYSEYIHWFSDPDVYESSLAYSGDFEYTLLRTSGDTIFCSGNYNKSNMFLVKAQAGDAEKIRNVSNMFNNIALIKTNYWSKLALAVGNVEYEIEYSLQQPRTVTLNYNENGVKKEFTTGYYFNESSLLFIDPFIYGGITIKGFQNMTYSDTENVIDMQIAGNGGSASIKSIPVTSFVDVDAAKEIFMSVGVYNTPGGFTVSGASDAYGIASISGFTNLQLYNNFFDTGTQFISALLLQNRAANFPGYYFMNDLSKIDEGEIGFVPYNRRETMPAAYVQAYNANLLLLLSNRFNVVKRSDSEFDLVSLDGAIWISFYKLS